MTTGQYYSIHRRQVNFKSTYGLGHEYLVLKSMLVNLSLTILGRKFTDQAFQNTYTFLLLTVCLATCCHTAHIKKV